ncbi:LIM/homeobox protein Lhx9-like, partial [Hetaerina americana]|uniref:LIM/homeobox protein Lhx9-like n=1 Tax=Hetaerina americana TaxID=62018 RepID=UPI003A7F5421
PPPPSPPPTPPPTAADDASGAACCFGCGGRICDRFYLLAVDRQWHSGCLKCCECKLPLHSELTCFARGGNIYCKEDYYRLYAVKRCGRCRAGISASELVMRAREAVYHLQCFTCATCERPLTKGEHFGMRDGLVYCRPHYALLFPPPYLGGGGGGGGGPGGEGSGLPPPPGGSHNEGAGVVPRAEGMGLLLFGRADGGVTEGVAADAEGGEDGGGVAAEGRLRAAGVVGGAFFGGGGGGGKGRPRKRKASVADAEMVPMRLAASGSLEMLHPGDLPPAAIEQLAAFDSSSVTSPGGMGQGGSGGQQRTKRMRTSFKHHQLRTMKSYFAINQNPDAKDLKQLAQKTGLSKRVLQVWFQNARAKWRRNIMRQESQQQGGAAPACPPSPPSDHSAPGGPTHPHMQHQPTTPGQAGPPPPHLGGPAGEALCPPPPTPSSSHHVAPEDLASQALQFSDLY